MKFHALLGKFFFEKRFVVKIKSCILHVLSFPCASHSSTSTIFFYLRNLTKHKQSQKVGCFVFKSLLLHGAAAVQLFFRQVDEHGIFALNSTDDMPRSFLVQIMQSISRAFRKQFIYLLELHPVKFLRPKNLTSTQ